MVSSSFFILLIYFYVLKTWQISSSGPGTSLIQRMWRCYFPKSTGVEILQMCYHYIVIKFVWKKKKFKHWYFKKMSYKHTIIEFLCNSRAWFKILVLEALKMRYQYTVIQFVCRWSTIRKETIVEFEKKFRHWYFSQFCT